MTIPLNQPATTHFGGLFNTLCPIQCEVYAACGGRYHTAPCGCAWHPKSGKRHQCNNCYLICRERKMESPDGLVPDFVNQLAQGKLLEQVSLRQDPNIQFPIFIPLGTDRFYGKDATFQLRWAAGDVRTLFMERLARSTELQPKLRDLQSARNYLRVDDNCRLLAVINGQDRFLESFWGMGERSRLDAFAQLKAIGFSAGTAATFSVTSRTYQRTPTPYAHNIVMLMRHHRVATEMQDAGLSTAPNLYWMDGDQHEIQRWAQWLAVNERIYTVSRDFSQTPHPKTVLEKVTELIQLLDAAGRSFHVLVVGTGVMTGPMVLRELANAGHCGTVVSSAPLYESAVAAIRYRLQNGRIVKEKDKNSSRHDLICNNMRVFEEALLQSVINTDAGRKSLPNILFGTCK